MVSYGMVYTSALEAPVFAAPSSSYFELIWRLSRFGGYLPRISDGGALNDLNDTERLASAS
jgi:hypothetical protein